MFNPERANPFLYILMRNDLASLNPGKMVAQGAHAANMFQTAMERLASNVPAREVEDPAPAGEQFDPAIAAANAHFFKVEIFKKWQASARDFGTTITLGVSGRELTQLIGWAKTNQLMVADIVLDPTYPLMDGKFLHLIPLETCGYIFADKSHTSGLLSGVDLLP